MNRCEVLRKANTKDKHMLGNINKEIWSMRII